MATVLVVEDDRLTCAVLARLLRAQGHEATCIPGGGEAIRQLDDGVPDLLILDLMMPGVSGLDVLRHLRRAGRPVRVVVYSALDDEEMQGEAMRLGAADYVVKGRGFDDLYAHIEPWLAAN